MQALEFVNYISDMLGYGQTTNVATNEDSDIRKVIKASNAVLKGMQTDKDWPELSTVGTVTIPIPVTTEDEASVALGSTAVTLETLGASDCPVGAMAMIDDDGDIYRVIASEANALTLDRPWRDASVTTADITIASDFDSLPSDLDRIPTAEMRNDETGGSVKETDPVSFRKLKIDGGASYYNNDPSYFTVKGRDSSGYKKVHFDTVPEASIVLSFDYLKNHPSLSANTTEILYPEKHFLKIYDAITARLRRDVEDSDRAAIAAQDALSEAIKVGKNPDQSRSKTRMRSELTKHGAYRRR